MPLRPHFQSGAVTAFFLCLLTSFPSPLTARTKQRPPEGKTIRRIEIVRKDIFDPAIPEEDRLIYRTINNLHFSTKESVIRNELLFKEGDVYDERLARETERALRDVLPLRNVSVTSIPAPDNQVDVQVETHDTWSTQPTLTLKGVGKRLSGKVGLREDNFLGYGKGASFFYKKEAGVIERAFSYSDPDMFHRHFRLDANYADSADGLGRSFSLRRPFYSSITPWSASVAGKFEDMDTRLYQAGGEVGKVRQFTREYSGGGSLSAGSSPSLIQRVGLGYRYLRESLTQTVPFAGKLSDKQYHIIEFPLHYEKVNFMTVDHINRYTRTEDFALGPKIEATTGVTAPWIGKSRNATFVKLDVEKGHRFGPSNFARTAFTATGRYEGRWQDSRPRVDIWYYNHFPARQTLALHLQAETIAHPQPNSQLLLGGDTGLRGYQLNQFSGNKLLLANAEHRLFWVEDIGRVMSLGSAAFFDAGNVWEPGKKIDPRNTRMSVGAGLRIHLPRTSLGHVLRLDVAYALKEVRGKSRTVITFGSEQAF